MMCGYEKKTGTRPISICIVFQDNLSGVLSGLTVVPGSFPAEPCGAGSSIILAGGDTLLIVTGGTLAAGASCSFSVTLQVPVGTTPDTFASATSGFTGVLAGSTVIFPNASDHLVVAFAPNDQCIEATIVTGDGSRRFTDTIDTLLATAEEDDPTPDCGTGPDGATVWYSYTPTTDGTTPIASEEDILSMAHVEELMWGGGCSRPARPV